jgi:hypothetical protein
MDMIREIADRDYGRAREAMDRQANEIQPKATK